MWDKTEAVRKLDLVVIEPVERDCGRQVESFDTPSLFEFYCPGAECILVVP